MERDLHDVLRDLRMGTAQVKTPEQFLALVAPGVAAIRESLESLGHAAADLRAVVSVELRQKGLDSLSAVTQQAMQQGVQILAAADAVAQAVERLDASVRSSAQSIARSANSADRSPRWRWRILMLGTGALAFWAYMTEGRIQHRFDVLEHNQLAIAARLGMPIPGAETTEESPSPPPQAPKPNGRPRRVPLLRFPLTEVPDR